MWPNPQETADLVTFSEEILNGKLHFLCTERLVWKQNYDVLDDTPDDDVLDVDKNYIDYIDYNGDNDDGQVMMIFQMISFGEKGC